MAVHFTWSGYDASGTGSSLNQPCLACITSFWCFCKKDESDPEVDEGAWPYEPYAVWTGSYNITRNGNASLENALFVQDARLAEAYCDEWAQLVEVSESLDWTE